MEGVSMTSPLPGYGHGLTDDTILGYIAWYTVTKPRLTHEDIMKLVTTHGLDPLIVPKPPRAGDAFKRACRYSERLGLEIPYSPNTANFLIRPVTQTLDDIERHVVLEIIDPEGRKLTHTTAAALRFDRKSGTLNIKMEQLDPELQPLLEDTMDNFASVLKDSTKYVEAQVIRRMIRLQLEHMHAVLARAKGSVYFIPKTQKKLMLGLEEFTANCGEGSVFHSLPLVDDTKQQELVRGAFEEGIHEQSQQMIAELTTHSQSGKEITANAWNDYKQRLVALTHKTNEYTELVDVELTKSQVELEAVNAQLQDFLLSGLVKS
jgi:hypothetical protein